MFDKIIISPHKQPEYDTFIENGFANQLYDELPSFDNILEMAKYHKDKGFVMHTFE